ncbi:hypothetical protein [Achromobacter sp.]|uniref:hypothetical protein n=1 Tax=Achromobacter sp. TaxID=134375 RepID=UPI003C774655
MNADTVQCVSCVLFSLREHAGMANQGLGRCAAMKDRPGTFVSPQYSRQCRDHQPAPAAKTAARIEWLRDVRSEGA